MTANPGRCDNPSPASADGGLSAPKSGLEHLCAGLAGTVSPPLSADLMARVRRSAGLVTHPAAVTRDLTGAVEALTAAGARLVALFGPEHGVRGEAPDGRAVPSTVDARSGLPVHSLYSGGAAAGRPLDPEPFRALDVLIVDLQDVGARFYTFSSTLSICMEAASTIDLPVVVLDRPNPIGDAIEGPLLGSTFASFIGLHPIPIRHGCTLGQLAAIFHRAYGVGAEPAVIPAEGMSDERGIGRYSLHLTPNSLPWVPPSPNIPTPLTALVYPGTALLEGTNVSEGRGTTRPFEWIGAPWVDADRLAERLRAYDLPGASFRPIHFIPAASKYATETCAGVQLHVTELRAFRPVLTGVAILAALRELWSASFAWRQVQGCFSIDRLAGTDTLRLAIDDGVAPTEIAANWAENEREFHTIRSDCLGLPTASGRSRQ